MGKMSVQELRQLASSLANSCHVRYWIHWSYPTPDRRIMALQVADWVTQSKENLKPVRLEHRDLERKGFKWQENEKLYLIECKVD